VIILDTNVISEPAKPRPDRAVIEWLDNQATETLYLTATSLSELLTGIEMMPKGRRRRALADDLDTLIEQFFGLRVLPFEREAAVVYSRLVGRARASGVTVSVADAQIAAIAEIHGFLLATRDTTPFAAMGTNMINPG
jgi:predicted nucleic acid-binding protein